MDLLYVSGTISSHNMFVSFYSQRRFIILLYVKFCQIGIRMMDVLDSYSYFSLIGLLSWTWFYSRGYLICCPLWGGGVATDCPSCEGVNVRGVKCPSHTVAKKKGPVILAYPCSLPAGQRHMVVQDDYTQYETSSSELRFTNILIFVFEMNYLCFGEWTWRRLIGLVLCLSKILYIQIYFFWHAIYLQGRVFGPRESSYLLWGTYFSGSWQLHYSLINQD